MHEVVFDNNNGTPYFGQTEMYYPFGMTVTTYISGAENKFKYNGKELEDEHGLNWYHYGVRYYDPQLGRWHTMDPVDEFYSPYVYVGNNPVRFIDPDGMAMDDYTVDKQGKITLDTKTSDDFDRLFAKGADCKIDQNNYIQVDKGILDKMYSQYQPHDKIVYDILKIRGDVIASSVFKFLAINTDVEWSQQMVGVAGDRGLNYLTTSRLHGKEFGLSHLYGTQLKSYNYRSGKHSHPGGGCNPSQGDVDVANYINELHPSATFFIFNTLDKKEHQYNKYTMPNVYDEQIVHP